MRTIEEQRKDYDEWRKSTASEDPWDAWQAQERLHAEDREIVALINELRSEEMSGVNILYETPDVCGAPTAIDVWGAWVKRSGRYRPDSLLDYPLRTFHGDSLLDCLRKAVVAKMGVRR